MSPICDSCSKKEMNSVEIEFLYLELIEMLAKIITILSVGETCWKFICFLGYEQKVVDIYHYYKNALKNKINGK